MAEPENKSPGSLSERVRSLRLTESTESNRSNGWWWMPWALCAALFLMMAFFALEALSPIDDELIKKLADERGLNVGKAADKSDGLAKLGLTGQSGSAATEIALESKGNIVPFSLIQVSPKVSGTVMRLFIREGMAVEKDTLLAVLEDVEYRADLDAAIGTKGAAQGRWDELSKYRSKEERQAKAELDEARYQLDQLAAKYTRTVQLKQRSAVAPEDLELAESGYRSMKSRVDRLELAYELMLKGPRDARIDSMQGEFWKAEADVVRAKWRHDNTLIKAPIKGIILSKKTEEGNMINPAAFSNGLSASLCEMADLHDLEVDLSIAERDISKLFQDQDCRIRAEAFPNRIYPGYVSRIMPMADRGKSAVPVRVKVNFPAVDVKGTAFAKDKQGEYLRPEMGAIVTFLNRKSPDAPK